MRARITKARVQELQEQGLKHCPKCGTAKPLGDFPLSSRRKDGRKGYCCECYRTCSRERARRNSATEKHLREKLKLQMNARFGGKCARCGYSEFPSSLQFHHVSGEKDMTVGELVLRMSHGFADWETIDGELDKCALLCANCHHGLHYGGWKPEWRRRSSIGYALV